MVSCWLCSGVGNCHLLCLWECDHIKTGLSLVLWAFNGHKYFTIITQFQEHWFMSGHSKSILVSPPPISHPFQISSNTKQHILIFALKYWSNCVASFETWCNEKKGTLTMHSQYHPLACIFTCDGRTRSGVAYYLQWWVDKLGACSLHVLAVDILHVQQ